ncbi:MAG: GNAT family N-acetyltransferase [Clostridia bacterium]|nr:GNAT family N-acetyltransferase [Clostridia bacterium]
MEFSAKFFSELTTKELYEIVRARTEVFLMEQKIICRDFDGEDYNCLHCFITDNGKVVAYLRAFKKSDSTVKIGRVLSVTHGVGLGRELMQKSTLAIKEMLKCTKIVLHAQKHAQGFYEKLGYVTTSEDFWEEDILHVAMERIL